MKHPEVTNETLPIMNRQKTIDLASCTAPGAVKRRVVAKEFTWHDTFVLLRMLSEKSKEVMDSEGKFSLRIDKIAELISGTQELSEFVITKSTGLSQEEVRQLSFPEGLELLDAALEINLNAEILGRAKKVGGRFTAAIGVKLGASTQTATPKPPQPSISSSVKDTASTT